MPKIEQLSGFSLNMKQPIINAFIIIEYSNGETTDGKQVCDLDTGICYTIRSRDGLIERVENEIRVNRKVQVESPNGKVKQLLNG